MKPVSLSPPQVILNHSSLQKELICQHQTSRYIFMQTNPSPIQSLILGFAKFLLLRRERTLACTLQL